MKKDGVSKDVSYEELVAKYGDRYYKKELEAAYAKYTKKRISSVTLIIRRF